MEPQIYNFRNWIFDMDGTLTIACHDFDEIRCQLGLPEGLPILEELKKYPKQQAQELHRQLFEIEMDLAGQARPQPGIAELLDHLNRHGYRLGVITRNSLEIAFTTLKACGLIEYFEPDNILGRECCVPKPDPQGVLQLIHRWNCQAHETVVVGDYLFDLQCGHAAGVYTIHFDTNGQDSWPDFTDFKIREFNEITRLLMY